MTDISLRRGDTKAWIFYAKEDGAAMDLSTVSLIRFSVKRAVDYVDTAAILRKSSATGGVVTLTQDVAPPTGTLGCFMVTLTHLDTQLLDPDMHMLYDIQFTMNDGSVSTPFYGGFRLYGDVTRNSAGIGTDV